MDKELKQKWVAALRSGEYKQGRNALRSADDEYCCLGVLCELIPDRIEWKTRYRDDVNYTARLVDINPYYDGTSTGVLPGRLADELELRVYVNEVEKEVDGVRVYEALIRMNDDGATFSTIADYIKEHL